VSTDGVIDRQALDRIRALQRPGAPDLVAQIVQSYLSHAATLVENLAVAVQAGNVTQVKDLAHSFKSSSANVGALALAGRCKELELLARAGTLAQAATIHAAIEQEFTVARGALGRILAESRS
jgi:HPt (histidine-containing phosphotransfer) domain-containing protein